MLQKDDKRMMVDLTKVWKKVHPTVSEDLFKNTASVLLEEHYRQKGLLITEENGGSGNGNV